MLPQATLGVVLFTINQLRFDPTPDLTFNSAQIRMMRKLSIPLAMAGILAFVYCFPRLLLSWREPDDPWLNYSYQYGLGLLVFIIGIWVILSSGSLKLGRGNDSKWFKVLIAGFCVYAVVHATWIWAALSMPLKGTN